MNEQDLVGKTVLSLDRTDTCLRLEFSDGTVFEIDIRGYHEDAWLRLALNGKII